MRRLIIKRIFITALLILGCYVLQSSIFSQLTIAGVQPNIILILVCFIGITRGSKEGMFVGFVCGFLMDVQFRTNIGWGALILMLIGYINGFLRQYFNESDLRLPLFAIASSSFSYGMVMYFSHFLLRFRFNILFYLNHIIVPELIYTIIVSVVLYPLLLWINQRLEVEEKRRAGSFAKENT